MKGNNHAISCSSRVGIPYSERYLQTGSFSMYPISRIASLSSSSFPSHSTQSLPIFQDSKPRLTTFPCRSLYLSKLHTPYDKLTPTVDIRLYSSPTNLLPPHLNRIPKRRLLAPPSNRWNGLHHLRDTIHARNTAEMVSPCLASAWLAYWSLESRWCKPSLIYSSISPLACIFPKFFSSHEAITSVELLENRD